MTISDIKPSEGGSHEASVIPVILAGGEGSRLWPLSRKNYPKQFLQAPGSDHTFFELTVLRALDLITGPYKPIVVVNEANRFLVAESLRLMEVEATIILEPVGRNTAPAIAVAAMEAIEQSANNSGGVNIVVLSSDQLIQRADVFVDAVNQAKALSALNRLVTFGIVPTGPETGFGYIKCGQALQSGFEVDAFIEKPERDVAAQMIDAGGYYWNGGLFLFDASFFLQELARHQPKMFEAIQVAYGNRYTDMMFLRLPKDDFENVPAESIDYAVMELSDSVAVVPLDAGWNDVGSWDAMWETGEHDESGNVVKGDVILENTVRSFVHADSRLVTAVGMENVIVVETADAVLVANRQDSQSVKRLVAMLESHERKERTDHVQTYRPWGWFESICNQARFQVKRIVVKPGASLSLQMHHHRAEHWVVVRGSALVQSGTQEQLLSEGESTYIPLGELHRLSNPGKIELEIIEIQTGSYLGEDDIVRFDDDYGR